MEGKSPDVARQAHKAGMWGFLPLNLAGPHALPKIVWL